MLEIIPIWLIMFTVGILVGGWLWHKVEIKYCTECENSTTPLSNETDYCPFCGHETNRKQIRRIYILTPYSKKFIEPPQQKK